MVSQSLQIGLDTNEWKELFLTQILFDTFHHHVDEVATLRQSTITRVAPRMCLDTSLLLLQYELSTP